MTAENEPETLELEVTPQVVAYLEGLVSTGLYGVTVEEAAERLMCQEIRRLIVEGYIRKRTDGGKR